MQYKGYIRKCKRKYDELPIPLKATVWITICNFLQRGISMLTTPIFTRILSEEQYGIINTYNSWQMLLVMITTLSLSSAIMNLYVIYDDKEEVLSSLCGLELLVTILFFILFVGFFKPIYLSLRLSKTLVISLFVSFIFQGVINCWYMHCRYVYSYKKMILVTTLLTAVSSIMGVIVVIFFSPTAEGRVLPQLVMTVVVGCYVLIDIFSKSHSIINKKVWTFALSYCIPLMPHFLSEYVLQSSDKLMINYMCGSRDVAVYSIAYAVGSLILLVTSSINSSFAPYQFQKLKEKDYSALSNTAGKVLLMVSVVLMFIMLFSREIVLVFGGEKYLDSVSVIIPICLGVYFNYLFQIFTRVQEFYLRKKTIVIPSVLCAVLNIILNLIFIKKFGYQAAAYTTFICYLLFCFIHYYFYKRLCKKELAGEAIYNIKQIVMISGATVIMGGILFFINRSYIIKNIVIISLITIFILNKNYFFTLIKDLIKTNKE